MSTFKEEFAKKRKELGAGKTFTWKDKNGKVGTYSTNYAEEEKKPTPSASNKPKARPTNLVPQSGAAQSGTAGKVKPKESISGASRSTAGKVKPKVDMPARPTGGTKAKQIAKQGAVSSKVASNIAAAERKASPRKSVMQTSAAIGNNAGAKLAKALTFFSGYGKKK